MDENCSLSPNVAAERFWQRVPGEIRWTFIMAVVMGLVTHMYAFTNDLLNHDDIYHLLQCEYGAQSGRWFLPIVLGWDGTYSMPWLIGALSVLCLALTACFTVSLLRIQGRLGALITVTLLVAYPTVAATFSYMFTADEYFFGLFLASFAAYAAARMPRMGLPLGAVALILSLGIYQSYFPVAAVLMVGALLFDTLDGELSLVAVHNSDIAGIPIIVCAIECPETRDGRLLIGAAHYMRDDDEAECVVRATLDALNRFCGRLAVRD